MRLARWLVSLALLAGLAFGGTARAAEDTIPPGTVITMQNWQQYKQFMSVGLQDLFAGQYHWKLPPDVQLVVGAPAVYTPVKEFAADTAKYSGQVRIVNLPNGGHAIAGYVAGLPFPNPSAPMKGYKILVNNWYHYFPWDACGKHLWNHLMDRFGDRTANNLELNYRRLSYISDYGQPHVAPDAQGIYFSEFLMVLAPEESKYVSQLTLYYTDPNKPIDLFLFIPALRRTLRLSSAARCAPVVGTDLTQDDVKWGFNGGITRFDAKYLHDQKVLTLIHSDPKMFGNVQKYYYPSVLFPTPAVGKWQLRDVYVISAGRIPSQRSGYCYSRRVMYVDKETYNDLWNDLYDAAGKLWKIQIIAHIESPIPHEGEQFETGNFINTIWDVQNAHMTSSQSSDAAGRWFQDGENCRNYEGTDFTVTSKYNTVQALSQIMR